MPSVSRTEPKTKFWRSVTVGNFCTNVQSPGHRHLISRLYYRRSAAVYRRLRCAACLLSRKDCSVMKKINSTNNAEQPRPRVAHFAFEITLSQAITLTLLLVCSFSPRVQSIPRGPLIYARNDIKYFVRNTTRVSVLQGIL